MAIPFTFLKAIGTSSLSWTSPENVTALSSHGARRQRRARRRRDTTRLESLSLAAERRACRKVGERHLRQYESGSDVRQDPGAIQGSKRLDMCRRYIR